MSTFIFAPELISCYEIHLCLKIVNTHRCHCHMENLAYMTRNLDFLHIHP